MRLRILATTMLAMWATCGSATDWPQWGGQDSKNHVSSQKGLPESFTPVKSNGEAGGDTHVKWVATLGAASYGNPVIAGGRVFVGTDDKTADEDPRFTRSSGGMLKCFDEKTGKLLWQLVVPKRTGLPKEYHYGFQHLGICSSPVVDGDRLYIVTSAAEVLCLDVHGQAGGNRGPYTEEGQYLAGSGRSAVKLGETDPDILWRFDLIKDAGVVPHDATACSILMHGDLIYLSTSNGVDHPHLKMMAPDAPALIALDKKTGRLVAKENEQISSRVWHCQWSPPSLGVVNGKALIFFGGGDGFCYAFEALDGVPTAPVALKKVWWFDCNPPEYRMADGKPIAYIKGDKRKSTSPNKNDGSYVGPSEVIGSPVFHEGRVYVAIGQDPLHGRGRGILHCIDATKTGDITQSGRIWSYNGTDRTIATPTIAGGLVYLPDVAGRLHCLSAESGAVKWVHETSAETWGSALVADGKVYFGTQKDFWVMAEGEQAKVLSRIRVGAPVYSTPVTANGVLYVSSQRYLWAVTGR